jgi:iron complex outermembrane recepter protein
MRNRALWCALLAAWWLFAVSGVARAEDAPSGSEETISVGGGGKKKKKKKPAADAAPAEDAAGGEKKGKKKREMLSSGMTEISVTAQKRKQKAQEVPISIGVLNEQFIKDSGLTDVRDLQQYVPNLQISPQTDTRSTTVRIRGIGTSGVNAGFDPAVGTFIDGVYMGRPGMSLSDLLDIERVEVLRGPQGTLYGKNTAAGAINILSKKPRFEYNGEIEGVFSNYNGFEGRASVNAPIWQDKIATRISAYSVTRDGFDGNPDTGARFNDANKYGFKLRTLFNVTDALEWLVTLDYAYENTACCAPDLLSTRGFPSLTLRFRDLEEVIGGPRRPVDGTDRHIYSNQPTTNKVKGAGVTSEINWKLGEHTLTNISAYRIFNSDSMFDGDFSQYDSVFNAAHERFRQFSSELRLASPSGQRLEYVLGLYGFYGRDETIGLTGISNDWFTAMEQSSFRGLAPGIAAEARFLASTLRGTPPARVAFNTDYNIHKTATAAAFGQGTYKLSDQWSVTAGLRVMWERKTRIGTQRTAVGRNRQPFPIDASIFGPDVKSDDERAVVDATPMLSLRYFPAPDKMLFATGARGFKSGGFNQLRTPAGSTSEFDDEKATNFEAGAKTQWFNRRLTANASFFYTLFDDFQAQAFDGRAFTVDNAGSLTSYGVEADFVEVPHPTLIFGQNIGFNVAKYDSFKGAQCTAKQAFSGHDGFPGTQGRPFPQVGRNGQPLFCDQDLSGKPLDNAPQWSLSAWGQYEREIPTLPVLGFLRAEWSYRDRFFLAQDLDPALVQDPINLLNVRAGVHDANDRWEVTLWSENVTNETYNIIGFDVPIHNGYAAVVAPPRTFGLTVRLKF